MEVSEYVGEIQHAVSTVFAEIHRERDLLAEATAELEKLKNATDAGYRQVEQHLADPYLDDDGLATAIYWDTYFGPDKERFHKDAEVMKLGERVAAKSFSTAALAGNLLQYAKQGIALRYGKNREGCPDGRMIGAVTLHEVIWQARNQSMHWEEGDPHRPVQRCFDRLAEEFGAQFSEYRNRNLAFEVICLLGWSTIENFKNDLLLFAGEH